MKKKLAPCPDAENTMGAPADFCVPGGRPLPAKPTMISTVIKSSRSAVASVTSPITMLLIALWGAVNAKAAETNLVSLPSEPVTITNISGKVYNNVWLDHTTPDGVIYTSQDKASEGLIHYLDLTTNDLIKFKISPAVLSIAAARNVKRIRAEQAYQQAVIEAMKRRQQADLAQTNTPQNTSGDPVATWNNMKRALGKTEKRKAGLYQ